MGASTNLAPAAATSTSTCPGPATGSGPSSIVRGWSKSRQTARREGVGSGTGSHDAPVEERTFEDAHGVQVFSRWWLVEAPRGVVLLAHGASEHSGRYDRFARALNEARFAAVALDHRGHGRTGGSGGPALMGPGGGHAVVDDVHELRAAAAAEAGDGV